MPKVNEVLKNLTPEEADEILREHLAEPLTDYMQNSFALFPSSLRNELFRLPFIVSSEVDVLHPFYDKFKDYYSQAILDFIGDDLYAVADAIKRAYLKRDSLTNHEAVNKIGTNLGISVSYTTLSEIVRKAKQGRTDMFAVRTIQRQRLNSKHFDVFLRDFTKKTNDNILKGVFEVMEIVEQRMGKKNKKPLDADVKKATGFKVPVGDEEVPIYQVSVSVSIDPSRGQMKDGRWSNFNPEYAEVLRTYEKKFVKLPSAREIVEGLVDSEGNSAKQTSRFIAVQNFFSEIAPAEYFPYLALPQVDRRVIEPARRYLILRLKWLLYSGGDEELVRLLEGLGKKAGIRTTFKVSGYLNRKALLGYIVQRYSIDPAELEKQGVLEKTEETRANFPYGRFVKRSEEYAKKLLEEETDSRGGGRK